MATSTRRSAARSTLAKESGEPPTIQGRLDIVRGQYTFQGRRFTIARGSEVIFSGESFLNPALNVTAERQIGAVTAHVRVGGSARRPQLTLSSTPPLDQADVLSLIVFNQTMNELSTAERVSLAGRAGTLAARALATPLGDSVMRALDFDLFEITPNEDVSTGASLAIGRQVSDRLFVGFRQNFGADDVSQVSFEYRLTRVPPARHDVRARRRPLPHRAARRDRRPRSVLRDSAMRALKARGRASIVENSTEPRGRHVGGVFHGRCPSPDGDVST